MKVRRVVAGKNAKGKSVVVADQDLTPTRFPGRTPGFEFYEIWMTEGDRRVPHDGAAPGAPGDFYPGPDATVFRLFTMAPGAVTAMHASDTIDYVIVIDGELELEVDDGARVRLTPGSCVVQNGNDHLWRNVSARPVLAAAVLLGARRRD